MIDSNLEDRLHLMLEGRLGDAETASLRSAIARDPELRHRLEELEAAFSALSAAEMVEPPAGLRDGVLRAIRSEPVPGGRTAATAWSWPRLLLPAAAAVAALAVVGVLLSPPGRNAPGPASVQGTIGDTSPPAARAILTRGDLGTYALARADGAGAELAVEAGARTLALTVRWRGQPVRSARLASEVTVARPVVDGVAFTLPAGTRDRLLLGTTGAQTLTLDITVLDGDREVRVGSVTISPEGKSR